ncbi:uncharacterized protein LOC113306390 [Papaver somniferum]|uniref:uncharacterized protein LOC113306390 n=1 Tax=Papaver somniferum TaxID=3469 RepID=UPI000E6F61CB|nr:uncharacterized protein LOC113306390 [Papaver somniferum]
MRGIYVTSTDIIHSKTCHIHFIYGEPNSSLRQAFWEQQCQQPNAPLDEPVFFIGDFNATEDKNGGLEVDDPDFENLRNFCSVFKLHDPGFSGLRFTWDSYDHCPMHIGFNYEVFCMPRPFHFMAMWIEDPTCRDIIANSWSVNVVGSPAYKLKAKLLSTKKGLRDWNKSSVGNIQTNISSIRKDLADLQLSNPTDTNNTARLKARLEYLYTLEELYWKDKSREVWIMEGDISSPYFHRVTLFRIKRNAISWIKNSLNTILTDRDSIGNSFMDYFKSLYTSHPQQFHDEILADLPIKFSAEDNALLNMPLTPEEIKNVVFQMGGKRLLDQMVLLTLDNRLKPFMNNIISQNQSAFIPKRSISDNILLANEAIYVVNHNDKVEGIAAIKLDMSKAYDKLEWDFIEKPERGIRQGDPLYPYLYIISSEALSFVCKDAPEMTHLLFADDSLLFSKATTQNFQVIKDYLQKYCLASVQEINFEKSGIFFSRKIPEHRKALLANILEISSRDLGEKYLGTPTVFQASKIQTHIGEGGLGFRKAELNNLAMLARNAWRILENPNCLLATVLKAKYFSRTYFLNAKYTDKCSWTWKCLHAIKELIKPLISWIVGDGQFIYPYCDKWIPSSGSATPNPLVLPDPSIKVSYFIDPQSRSWDVSSTNTHFDNASVQKVISIPLSQLCTPDRRAWDISKNDKFSYKYAYLGLRGLRPSSCKNLWKRIWKVRVPYRIHFFLWRAARNSLPSRFIFHTRIPMHSVDCPRCSDPQETIMHALITCPFASRVWFISDFNISTQFFQNKSFIDWLLFWLIDPQSKLPEDDQYLLVAILWSLWTSRNNFIFQNIKKNHTTVLAIARAMLLTRKTSLPVSTTISVSICDKWMPPSIGWIKCNTDGAFDIISGANGAGYVMRGFSKKATFCASLGFEVFSAEEAEERTIWAVLKKSVEKQFTHIIIESDAKSFIDQFSAGNFEGNSRGCYL